MNSIKKIAQYIPLLGLLCLVVSSYSFGLKLYFWLPGIIILCLGFILNFILSVLQFPTWHIQKKWYVMIQILLIIFFIILNILKLISSQQIVIYIISFFTLDYFFKQFLLKNYHSEKTIAPKNQDILDDL